jgi:hypothetical protein
VNSTRRTLARAIAVLVLSVWGLGVLQAQAPTDENLTGRVYDVDYGGGPHTSTQVLIRAGDNSTAGFITKSELLQRILETAFLSATDVTIAYRQTSPKELVKVALRLTAPCSEKGCVDEIRCNATEKTCFAKIVGRSSDVRTADPRALGVLLTAIGKKKAADYLDIDKQGYILRVKINLQ